MSDSASCASADEDDWGKFPCSSALWKWRSLGPHAPSSGSATSTRQGGSNSSVIRSPQEKPQWPSARGYAQMAFHNGALYLHGGQDTINEATGDTAHFRDLFAYNVVHQKWAALEPSTIDRMAHSMHAVEFGGLHYLLVFGGFDPQGLKPELFDLQRMRWLQGPIPMCEKRIVDGSVEGGAPSVVVDNHGGTMDDLAATEMLLSRPPITTSRKRPAPTVHHFPFNDHTNRYLHSSVQNRPRHATSTSIYVFGGTDAQDGTMMADLLVIELTDAALVMDDDPSGGRHPCVAVSRPVCSGDAPSARLGHQACMLGSEAMLIYGGLDQPANVDGHVAEDLYLVFRLQLSNYVWSSIDVHDVPPCRMLFCMCPDRTNSKILIFGGRQPDDGNASDGEEATPFVDAFVGHITADIEPTDHSQLKHTISWQRAVSHDGPFPREYSDAAYCVVHAGQPSSSSDDETDAANGVRCYVFGGENSEGTCGDSLLELVVDARCLAQDGISCRDAVVIGGCVSQTTDESPTSDRHAPPHVVVALDDHDGAPHAVAQVGAGHHAQLQAPLGLSNTETSIALSVGSQHSTASPSRMVNTMDPSANELLHALVDCVAQLNDSVRRGFEDLQARTSEIERRIGAVEHQLHAGTSNPTSAEQRLMHAAIRQSLGAIEKELGLRR